LNFEFPALTNVTSFALNNLSSLDVLIFPNLTSIVNSFTITSCNNLTEIKFPNLSTIGSAFNTGFLITGQNVSLETLYFPRLSNIIGNFDIEITLADPTLLQNFMFCNLDQLNIGGAVTINMDTENICCQYVSNLIYTTTDCDTSNSCGIVVTDTHINLHPGDMGVIYITNSNSDSVEVFITCEDNRITFNRTVFVLQNQFVLEITFSVTDAIDFSVITVFSNISCTYQQVFVTVTNGTQSYGSKVIINFFILVCILWMNVLY